MLVEDTISAAKVWSAGISSCSLMGTHLGLDKVQEILQHKYSPIILALDRDATTKALALARELALLLPLKVMVLDKDLKYVSKSEIKRMVSLTC